MGDKSAIQWTDATWNPVVGCSVVSPGCTNCYAMKEARRLADMGVTKYVGLTVASRSGPVWNGQVRLHDGPIDQPIRWRKPRGIFVNSMSDLFHEDLPDEDIDRVFAIMALAPQHTFQVLTKRTDRARQYLSPARAHPVGLAALDEVFRIVSKHPHSDVGKGCMLEGDIPHLKVWPLPNVWLGASVEDQARADERIPDLLATPAAVRFLSCEPLLGPVNIGPWHLTPANGHRARIDWLIVGGESGRDARPMHPDWARSLRDQCASARVPFFFKQWGEWAPASDDEIPERFGAACDAFRCMCSNGFFGEMALGSAFLHKPRAYPQCFPNGADGDASCTSAILRRLGKKRAGRLLDGREWNEFPKPVER
jgi:protein gp37